MLTELVNSYVAMKRACGFSFGIQGTLLQRFAEFSEERGRQYVCSQTAIEWAGAAPTAYQSARRLGHVIRFSRYLRAEDARHELPPPIFGSQKRPRRVPYIFSKDEIRNIVQTTSQLGQRAICRETYSTLFALLACTGLRVSEAIQLRYEDVTRDGLIIKRSKFKKSRIVPLHESTHAALQRYIERRRTYEAFDDHVFISVRRKPLRLLDVEHAFRTTVNKIGLPRGSGLPRPTPHALRHSFAVRALETCPSDRDRITQHTVALSTYLGHYSPAETHWYLQATPQLMTSIAERCESFMTEGGRP